MQNESKAQMPAFGYELLRDFTLSSILGKNESDILYWAGKEMARQYPCATDVDVNAFFAEAGFGILQLNKELKDGYIFSLTNDPAVFNFAKRNFRLEAGFLAEQIQQQKEYLTECFDEKQEKNNTVLFTVKWDAKETCY